MDNNLKALSKSKIMTTIKAQLHVRLTIFKSTVKVQFTKMNTDELKAKLLECMKEPVPDELSDLLQIVLHPESVIGMSFSQRWIGKPRKMEDVKEPQSIGVGYFSVISA